jgi:tetratricopeptide (TPR) repeat protein
LIWTASRSESEGSGVYESLAWCKSQRQIGNYEDAIGVLTKKDLSDPSIILELQRVYMEQGYIEKAMRCLEYFISLDSRGFSRDLDGSGVLINPEDTEVMSHSVGVGSTNDGSVFRDTSPVARQLLTLRSKFLSCKVYGGWDEALDSAKITFETYLKLWRLPTGSAESPILLVS